MNSIEILKKKFSVVDDRTRKINKNIIASFFIKATSIIIGFFMVRLTLDYLDETRYGIWLTLSSIVSWVVFFEIGLGNGLRNKLAEALAKKDYNLGKIYVSTTYAILTGIIIFCASIFFIANIFIDWTIILNTDEKLFHELKYLALILFGFFFLRFIVKLINVILLADQRPALANFFSPLANFISLIVVFILFKTTSGSLIYLGWALSTIPVLVLSAASIYLFSNEYKKIAPSIKFIKFSYAKDLLNLGLQFFFLQVAGLVIYQSSNLIIIQFFGPNEVTVYNISFKYFSVITMAFTIITIPFWSAFTDAWVKREIEWIKLSIRKLMMLWGIFCVSGIVMLLFAEDFYKIWIGDKISIPFGLSFCILLYFLTQTFGGAFNMFINGVGKIKLQMYSSLIGAVIFICSAILFAKYSTFGIIGIVLSSIISNFYGIFLTPIQYHKIINNKAKGIWDR